MRTQEWHFEAPTIVERSVVIQLLTIAGVSVPGRWSGQIGQFYTGWAPITSEMVQHYAN